MWQLDILFGFYLSRLWDKMHKRHPLISQVQVEQFLHPKPGFLLFFSAFAKLMLVSMKVIVSIMIKFFIMLVPPHSWVKICI
jgi:hypothetical protein